MGEVYDGSGVRVVRRGRSLRTAGGRSAAVLQSVVRRWSVAGVRRTFG
jgi:hypothetical protein